jgi:hypothetical protein
MDHVSDPALVSLPLDPISPRLPLDAPFTPAIAARAGIGRAVLERLVREGRVRRLLRGVYLDATAPTSVSVRARALGLVVGPRQVVIGTTAAWLHGVEVPRADPVPPVEVLGRSRHAGRSVRLAGHDLQTVEGLRCTTPLRTALDLGRWLAPDRALAALDGLLGTREFSHTALMAEVSRFGGQRGIAQLRELAAVADARARGAAESVLRLRWLEGRLPTPTPGLVVPRPGGAAARLALGLEVHRFGAVLAGQLGDADLAALGSLGWRVVVLDRRRTLGTDPAYLVGHLEREFHLHLLAQVG